MILSRKTFLPIAAIALMALPALSSQAATITLSVPSGIATQPTQNNFIAPGVQSDNGRFNASLVPSLPVTFIDQSNVSYGVTQIGGGAATGTTTDTFTARPASFTFDVFANNVTNVFVVNGEIDNGLVGTTLDATGGSSSTTAFFKVNSLVLNGTTTFTNVVSSPNAGRTSLVATNVAFGSTLVNVYVEQANGLTAPSSFTNLSVGGYIGVAVPEPGSVAMLVGMGVTGAGFLVRRKRARKA